MHRKELVTPLAPLLSNSPLTRSKKNEKLQQSEPCIFEDVGNLAKVNVKETVKPNKHYLAGVLKTHRTKIAVF